MSNGSWDFSNRVFVALVVLVASFLVYSLASALESWRNYSGYYPREITVEGTGEATIAPDVAMVSIGVHSEGAVAEQVSEQNSQKVTAIVNVLKENGVDEKHIKTTNLYLNPKYGWSEERGSYQDGFTAEETLTVKIYDLDKAGSIVGAATKAGANTVGGIQFEVEDEGAALEEARDEAIAEAKEKAKAISKATGLRLGRVLNFWEYNDGGMQPYGYGGVMMERAADSAGSAVPAIAPGQQDVKLRVSLTYRVY